MVREKKMINIPASLGIRQEKRQLRRRKQRMYVWAIAVLVVVCGLLYAYGRIMQEAKDQNIQAQIQKFIKEGKPVAILELEYDSEAEKAYFYTIMTGYGMEPVTKNSYIQTFFVRRAWLENAGINRFYQKEQQLGKLLVENDYSVSMEKGHVYLLFLYEREPYQTDFYPIDSGAFSIVRQSVYYIKPEEAYIERVSGGYLLPDGDVVFEEEFNEAMEIVLNGL